MDDISYLGASNTINSYNLFTYCEGNPVMFVDYDGTDIEEIIEEIRKILNSASEEIIKYFGVIGLGFTFLGAVFSYIYDFIFKPRGGGSSTPESVEAAGSPPRVGGGSPGKNRFQDDNFWQMFEANSLK